MPVAVSAPDISTSKILLPGADQPVAVVGGQPVYLDPVWRRALQQMIDRQAALIVLANAIKAEVNAQHP